MSSNIGQHQHWIRLKVFHIYVPASDDFTDLSETMIYVKVGIKDSTKTFPFASDKASVVDGFGCALFKQIDFYLGSVNTAKANNLYQYQAFIEDLIFRHPKRADSGAMWDDEDKREKRISKTFDLYLRLHNPICQQDKLIPNGIPILIRLTKSSDTFGLKKTNVKNFKVNITEIAIHIRRVKRFPDVSLGIQEWREKAPAKYFVTRSKVKSSVIPKSNISSSFESVFSGVFLRHMLIGFLDDDSFVGKPTNKGLKFENLKLNYIAVFMNGNQVPSIAYSQIFIRIYS